MVQPPHSQYIPIDCAIYDHLELACVRSETLRITTLDGAHFQGEAIDVGAKRKGDATGLAEYLVLNTNVGSDEHRIELMLSEVHCIESVSQSASFKSILLQPPPGEVSI